MKKHPNKIRNWMRREIRHHASIYIDEFNEINATKLAEDCANEFDLYEDDDCTIPQEVFDIAADVALNWEKSNG